MIQPEKEELRALFNLKSTKDFEVIVAWMDRSLIKQSIDNNNTRDETESNMTKGRNQELEEFLTHVKDAEINFRNAGKAQQSTPS